MVAVGGMCQQWAMLSSSFRAVLYCNVHRKCFKYIHMPESGNKEEKMRKKNGGEIFGVQENAWRKPKGSCQCTPCKNWICVCVRKSYFTVRVSLYVCECVCWQGQQTPMHSGKDVARRTEDVTGKLSHWLGNTLLKFEWKQLKKAISMIFLIKMISLIHILV